MARASYANLVSGEVPDDLLPGSYTVEEWRTRVRVVTYSKYDPLELPADLLPVLGYFDGRPTQKVLAKIEAETGHILEEGLVRALADFEVLVGG